MKLIKNAFVYRINLPAAAALQDHLATLQHRPILETEAFNAGFVLLHGEQVMAFDGGIAFAVRFDEKLLPASVINEEAKRRIEQQALHTGVKLGKVEREAIKDMVVVDLLRVSHVRSKTVTSFYHPASRLLIVNTSSKRLAGVVTSLLIKAVGAAKTETINVSDVKGGLTTRMAEYLASLGDGDQFGEFSLEPDVWLQCESGKVTYQIDSLETGNQGLVEALAAGFKVNAVRLGYGPASFKLTSDFEFKAIRFDEGEPGSYDDVVDEWKHEANLQVFSFVQAIEALCVLFDYQEPKEETAAEAEA